MSAAAVSFKNILLIHEVLPHFDCSGSDLRLMDVIREIRAQGHALTYLARDGANCAKYEPALKALGVQVLADDPERIRNVTDDDRSASRSFREFLERGQFHLAILFHWFWSGISVPEDYLHDIRRFSPKTRILVMSDDRHGERERRLAKLTASIADLERADEFESREAEVYRQADLVLHISAADARKFLQLCPGLQIEMLPMQAEIAEPGLPHGGRERVLFLGNFDNLANRDALAWFLEAIWPLVLKEEPSLQLLVAGNAAPKEIETKFCNVACVGSVPELAPLFAKSRVFAAPIRYGTGINTKNLQAMAHGLPLVTTSIGAEGIELENGVDALVADAPHDFAGALVRLYRDAALWEKMAGAARQTLAARFSREHFQEQIRKIIARAAALPVKALDTEHEWSYQKLARAERDIIRRCPARYRLLLSVMAHWQAGTKLLAENLPDQAVQQFRHVFAWLRGALPETIFQKRLFADMAEAYRVLGNKEAAERCESTARRLIPAPCNASALAGSPKASQMVPCEKPEISVIVPTYNRRETLRLCLAALAFQSLPADSWELIVVDDGSTDGTDSFCRDFSFPNPNFRYLRQANSGAGAARRAGVEAARGEFVLLLNDDSIGRSDLLAEHLKIHRERQKEKWAVLGAFRPSEDARRRPLSCWINHSPFLFPQNTLKPGAYRESAYFITCNLSIRRDAVLEAGNFDAQFRVAEDTELGERLVQRGYQAWFHPNAQAWHEHGAFTVNDLVRRARAYGEADWQLFKKHPHLLGNGSGRFGLLRDSDLAQIQASIEKNREAVAVGFSALQKTEELEMAPLLKKQADGRVAAEELWTQLGKVVPLVYWQYLFESFLAARERGLQSAAPEAVHASPFAAVV